MQCRLRAATHLAARQIQVDRFAPCLRRISRTGALRAAAMRLAQVLLLVLPAACTAAASAPERASPWPSNQTDGNAAPSDWECHWRKAALQFGSHSTQLFPCIAPVNTKKII